jgi:hypothetical protein
LHWFISMPADPLSAVLFTNLLSEMVNFLHAFCQTAPALLPRLLRNVFSVRSPEHFVCHSPPPARLARLPVKTDW